MAYLLASIPYFRCLVRSEYLRDFEAEEGEAGPAAGQYHEATAVAVMAVRADSLWFQVVLHEPLGGCAFLLPIEALVTKPAPVAPTKTVQPWDCFSSDIGVCEIAALRRTGVRIHKDDVGATYLFTIASTGTDVADDPAQRKLLHVVSRSDGLIGAYPNNRIRFLDRALFGDLTEKPEFKTLTREFRAEGIGSGDRPAGREAGAVSPPLDAAPGRPNGAHA